MQPQTDPIFTSAWQLGGVLGVVVAVLAGVIVYLFRYNARQERKRDMERAKELEARLLVTAKHDLEIAKLRGDYEERAAKLAVQYGEGLKHDREAALAREDRVRESFSNLLLEIEAEGVKNANQLHEVLSKFYERFVGPTRRY